MPKHWRVIAALLFAQPAWASDATPGLSFGAEEFAQADIVDARAQPELDGRVSILFTLEEPAAARLATFSAAHIGKAVPVIFAGRELAAPILAEAISTGTFQISGAFTLDEAKALALAISGKPPLADSLEDE